jgi:hypothetical protein
MTRCRGVTALRPWGIAVCATVAAWSLAEGASNARLATSLVITIAALKSRIVVGHFMRINSRVWPWRLILDAWIAVISVIVLCGYWSVYL